MTEEAQQDMGEVSDGYHTFNELYEHRCTLFVALMMLRPDASWYSRKHADGSEWEGWFIAGMTLPDRRTVTYHLPARDMDLLTGLGIEELERAPEWDGHTSADVVKRLRDWIRWCGGAS